LQVCKLLVQVLQLLRREVTTVLTVC
jgi:hypothetical protein